MTGEELSIFISKNMFMKISVNYCLNKGNRQAILGTKKNAYGAPVIKNNKILVPKSAIDAYAGAVEIDEKHTVKVKEKKGEREYLTVALDKIEELYGIKVSFDNMGLITLSREEISLNRKDNLNDMMNIMKKFIYEFATPCEVYEDAKKHTNNFKHPFIFGDDKKFSELKEVYNANEGDKKYNKNLKAYIDRSVKRGVNYYKDNALSITVDGEENFDKYYGIKPECIPVNKNNTPDGCDVGGRLSIPSEVPLYTAFAYRMTGDEKYAKFAYDYQLALGKWNHWCPGHFLNCSMATLDFALALDWLYNAYVEFGKEDAHYDVSKIEEICYTHGVEMGYLASFEGQCPWPSLKVGNGGFVYHKKANNWNAVCTAGMTLASFVLMGNDKYKLEASSLVSDGIYYLANYGLGQYAPDGSYIESPTYWSYGTNNFFFFIASLLNATGKDYGYLDTWGIDKTCDFAVNSESSDYKIWTFHDGGIRPSAMDTSWFPFFAEATGNKGYMKIREEQLKGGKSASIYELFYYKEHKNLNETLPLSYYMEGIDTFTARSSWERGSIFTGIHGSPNSVPHGDIDCGQFIYYNKGKNFFVDMGSDNYNVYRYWSDDSRFKYYRKSAEGANAILLTSQQEELPLGQDLHGTGVITRHEDLGDRVISVLDDVSAYGGFAEYSVRGLLMKDNRETVIIQDEIDFKNAESGYWFGHIDRNDIEKVEVSSDGKTAYLTAKISDSETATLRATVVSPELDLKFKEMDCYTFVLQGTRPKGESEKLGGVAEYERDTFSKLAIEFNGVKNLKLAVVLEMVNGDRQAPVSYNWQNIADWQ